MESALTDFADPITLADGRTWTARFDSFDQRTDCCYYGLAVTGPTGTSRFVVRVDIWWSESDVEPKYRERLQDELSALARKGHTNTEWKGMAALQGEWLAKGAVRSRP